MNNENIYQIIKILLENKNYYNFRNLDKCFYINGKFTINDETILKFHDIFGINVSTIYDYYLWTLLHEYLVDKNLIHDSNHKHVLNQNELMIPSELIEELSDLLKDTGLDLKPYCQVKKEHLFFMGGNLVLDNIIESNVQWNVN